MKYDDPIIEQDNEVHTMIMDMIRPGSKVLEFGIMYTAELQSWR